MILICLSPHFAYPLESQESDPGKYDLVILDNSMGGGELDGLPTLLRIRSFFAARAMAYVQPPIVVLSGESDPKEQAKFLDAGATRVLLKPAKPEEIKGLHALASQHRAQASVGAGGGQWIRPAALAGPAGGSNLIAMWGSDDASTGGGGGSVSGAAAAVDALGIPPAPVGGANRQGAPAVPQ